jgi:hypothetical protein
MDAVFIPEVQQASSSQGVNEWDSPRSQDLEDGVRSCLHISGRLLRLRPPAHDRQRQALS